MQTARQLTTTVVVLVAVVGSLAILIAAALDGDPGRAVGAGGEELGLAASAEQGSEAAWPDRPTPWALLGTVDRGAALRLYPLTRRPSCGRFAATAREPEDAGSVEVDVVIDHAGCPEGTRELGEGELGGVAPKSIVVKLDRPLDGRAVTGSMLEMPERNFGDRVVDLRGLSVAQAEEVASMLRATLDVHGPDAHDGGTPMVSRQRPLNIGPGQRPPADVYDVFTRAGR